MTKSPTPGRAGEGGKAVPTPGVPAPSLVACKTRHRNIAAGGSEPGQRRLLPLLLIPIQRNKSSLCRGRAGPLRAVMGADSSGGSGHGQAWAGGELRSPPRLIALPAELTPPCLPPCHPQLLERHCLRCEKGGTKPSRRQGRGAPQVVLESRISAVMLEWLSQHGRQPRRGELDAREGGEWGERERMKPHPCPVLLLGHPSHSTGRGHKG